MEHGPIVEVIPDIFVVSGVMRSEQNSTTAQFSRNMVIIREGEHLTIVNSILLDEDGLDELECLGMVTNVVSLGQAHGRDDEFYLDRWGGKLWAPANLQHRSGRAVDVTLVPEGPFPVENCSYIGFSATTGSDEGVLLLNRAGGIALVCDSFLNWPQADSYFDEPTAHSMQEAGLLNGLQIGADWLKRSQPTANEFSPFAKHSFENLLPAHGVAILGGADSQVRALINELAGAATT